MIDMFGWVILRKKVSDFLTSIFAAVDMTIIMAFSEFLGMLRYDFFTCREAARSCRTVGRK